MPTDAQKRRVERWCSKYKSILLMNAWTVFLAFDQRQVEGHGENTYTLAQCEVLPCYLTANLTVFADFWKQPKSEQERTILHEMLHALTEAGRLQAVSRKRPSMEEVRNVNEQLTEHITNVVWRALKKG